MPTRIFRVDIDRLVEEVQQRHNTRTVRHKVQRIVPLAVRDIGIGVVGDEELDDVEVPVSRGPLHGCGDEVSAERIDLGAVLEEEAAGCEVGVYGCPVQGCDVLVVAVVYCCFAAFDELAKEGDVASLGSDKDA